MTYGVLGIVVWLVIALIPARSAQARKAVIGGVIGISLVVVGYAFLQFMQDGMAGRDTESSVVMFEFFLIMLGPGCVAAFIRLLLLKPDRP